MGDQIDREAGQACRTTVERHAHAASRYGNRPGVRFHSSGGSAPILLHRGIVRGTDWTSAGWYDFGMTAASSSIRDGSETRIGIAVVRKGETVLVGIRDRASVLGGMHEFPGGKCRTGESPDACAVRECREETGLDVAVVELLDHRRHRYDHGELELSFFLCRPLADQENLSPARPFAWVPISRLNSCTFPPANQTVLARLSRPDAEPG